MSLLKEVLLSKTILIVDDTPNNLQLLAEYLDNVNCETLMAISGQRAISIARKVQPDLILLDVMMPKLDGFDVCRQLKSDPLTKDIPIIFMTALNETTDKIKGLELGAVDYVTKPFEEEELLTRLRTHLSLNHLYQASIEDAERRKLMLEISDRMRKSLDLEVILTTATTEISNLLDCSFVTIASLKEQKVAIEAYTSSSNNEIEFQAPIAPIPYDYLCYSQAEYEVYLQGEIKLLNNPNPAIPLPSAQSRLIVPIVIDDTDYTSAFFSFNQDKIVSNNILYGWLIVDRNSDQNSWGINEISLLKELTTHLAMGIKQGLLHQKLSELALLDSLTRIYNRRSFDQKLLQEWGRLKRIQAPLSLIMCDLDYFKVYNDTYGHQQGDKCLQQVAKAISTALKRPADIIARYGGEEFAIILPHTHQAGATKVGEAIRTTVKQLEIPHQNSLTETIVTVSVGAATTIPNAVDNPELLIEAADLALYQAKESGRDRIIVYPEPITHAKNREDLKILWIKRLRQALEQNLFSLYVQSITPLKENDRRQNFEVLLRLTDQANEVILPGVFLDIAERNFLITDIDTWVINNLFATLEHCDRNLWQDCRFSVNLSGSSLNNESFLNFLMEKLTESPLPGELFCFEISESIAVSNMDQIVEFMNYLKKIGCSFALDDFGQGVSSLTYLKNLPVDYLKIDGSFIKELNVSPASKVMVEAINHIAAGIGLKTVAEFVENEDILNSVRDLNVDYAQGFHLSHPTALMDIISKKLIAR